MARSGTATRRSIAAPHPTTGPRTDPGPTRASAAYRAGKRAFDVVVAASLLLATAPVLGVAALAIKCTSPGPVLYRARRAGRGGAPFAMLKFRTMRASHPDPERKITAAVDDRITRIGALLRKTKIDELPQLWNVLRGDMSIVGPRPEDWDLVQRHYTREHMRSLATRPGIACTAEYLWYPDLTHHDPAPPGVSAQAHYVARHLPLQATAGARYVDRQSFGYDLWILARTAFCVLVHCWRPPARRPLPPLPATTRDAAGAIAP